MTLSVSINHIDTCVSCFLQDHHNRDGEFLLGVYVDGATTYAVMKEYLIWAADHCDVFDSEGNSVEGLTDDVVHAAIDECFSRVKNMDAVFCPYLEIPDDDSNLHDGGEFCQAWFLLTYEQTAT